MYVCARVWIRRWRTLRARLHTSETERQRERQRPRKRERERGVGSKREHSHWLSCKANIFEWGDRDFFISISMIEIKENIAIRLRNGRFNSVSHLAYSFQHKNFFFMIKALALWHPHIHTHNILAWSIYFGTFEVRAREWQSVKIWR